MEIEKKRETSWKIQLKEKEEYIEITSVEISGEVREIKLLLLNKGKSVKVRLNKAEFFKFLSLISAFKDVLIGEDSITSETSLEIINNQSQKINDYPEINNDIYQIDSEPTDESLKNTDTEELNPEEWDPW
ncbi:MAG: hypothetical protein ACTSQD_00785 [Promethearchaeota archaeon]